MADAPDKAMATPMNEGEMEDNLLAPAEAPNEENSLGQQLGEPVLSDEVSQLEENGNLDAINDDILDDGVDNLEVDNGGNAMDADALLDAIEGDDGMSLDQSGIEAEAGGVEENANNEEEEIDHSSEYKTDVDTVQNEEDLLGGGDVEDNLVEGNEGDNNAKVDDLEGSMEGQGDEATADDEDKLLAEDNDTLENEAITSEPSEDMGLGRDNEENADIEAVDETKTDETQSDDIPAAEAENVSPDASFVTAGDDSLMDTNDLSVSENDGEQKTTEDDISVSQGETEPNESQSESQNISMEDDSIEKSDDVVKGAEVSEETEEKSDEVANENDDKCDGKEDEGKSDDQKDEVTSEVKETEDAMEGNEESGHVTNDTADDAMESGDVTKEKDDITTETTDITNEGEDVTKEGEDISKESMDVAKEDDAKETEDISSEDKVSDDKGSDDKGSEDKGSEDRSSESPKDDQDKDSVEVWDEPFVAPETTNTLDEIDVPKKSGKGSVGGGSGSGRISLDGSVTDEPTTARSSTSKTSSTSVKKETSIETKSAAATSVKSEVEDGPRRHSLRKKPNPVSRYGYEGGSIKDELIDLDDFDDDYLEASNPGVEVKDKKPIKPLKSTPKTEPQQNKSRVAPPPKAQACIVCCKVGKCKFNIVRNGDTKHLCDDKCFREFRAAPTRFLKSDKDVKPVPKSTPKAAKPAQASSAILTCTVCQVMNINAKKPFISWNAMDMCSEDCLSKFKVNLGTCCGHCGSHITLSQRGNTTLKIGADLKQFCNNACMMEHKKRMKVCSTCEKDLAGNPDAFVAPIGNLNEFKDFCSPECLNRYDTTPATTPKSVTVSNVDQRVIQPCAVCSKVKPAKHTVDLDKKKHYMCSAPCLSAFQYANKLSTSCDNCGAQCYNEQSPPQFIQFEGYQKRFCCTNCVSVFKTKNKKLKPCTWCRTKKVNFDMIERVDANNEYQLFCSLNCLSLYRVNLQATSNQIVTCDHCKKIAPAQYHLTMSDASVRNFCSYSCVMTFQSAFNAGTMTNGTVPQKGSVTANKQAAPPAGKGAKNDAATMPVISSVMSLAPAKGGKATVTIKGAANTPAANKKAPAPAPTPPPAPPPPVQVTRQIVVQPAAPKEYRNKAIICRPFVQTKATSCRPHIVETETQTDKDMMPRAFVPIPVPIFIPVPMAMFSAPTPIVVPIPVPIPIPVFLPTTKKTTAGIARRIKEILEKTPSDPLEAELLKMAEAVSTDKKDSDDDSDEYEDAPVETEKPAEKKDATQNGAMSEDMLQMALRMATEMSGNVTDIEAHLSQKALQPVTPSRYTEPEPEPEPEPPRHDTRKRTRSTGGRGRGRGRGGKRTRMDDSPPRPEPTPQPPAPPPQPTVSPDAEYHLKFMYGVNAWKHWVVMKNQQISQLPRRLQGAKLRFFKTDLLQCTADEINYSLCLFVKEVCKPNGDKYAADSIYYLCLGIQQYLHENGRIDNIFMDVFYERFTDCLNEVVGQYEPTINAAGQLVCRIEEEHLWECKQLGAHSPQVLLNTLVYFNSKYFMLFTAQDHINLSFSHIMKHWKKTNTANGTPGRCVYLRYQQPMAKLTPDAVKKKHTPVYFEQCENVENPLRCPVKLYEFYLSKCPDSIRTRNDVFYLVPERSCVPDSPVWYSTAALGIESMQKMLNRTRLIKEIQEMQLSA